MDNNHFGPLLHQTPERRGFVRGMEPVTAKHCDLRADGLLLTFSDGKSFFYPQAFLFATRFTHGIEVVPGYEPGPIRKNFLRSLLNPDHK